MRYWTELRTAFVVGQLGTVKAAAEELGVHRATVNRHIEPLEKAFGVPIFYKHARGYSLTDAGEDMLEVASKAEEMFSDLAGRSRAQAGLESGRLILTSLPGVAPSLMPAIKAFHRTHPEIEVEFLPTRRQARLEYGEAHIAVRSGPKPVEPDYVVQAYKTIRWGLFASEDYIETMGLPEAPNFDGHKFVGPIDANNPIPFAPWMSENVAFEDYAMMTQSPHVTQLAVAEGLGIGFVDLENARYCAHLVEIPGVLPEPSLDLWVVTHVDLHRTNKVQTFLKFLKATAHTERAPLAAPTVE